MVTEAKNSSCKQKKDKIHVSGESYSLNLVSRHCDLMIDVLEQDPTPSVVSRPPDTVDTRPVNGAKFYSAQRRPSKGLLLGHLLVELSQLRIYAK